MVFVPGCTLISDAEIADKVGSATGDGLTLSEATPDLTHASINDNIELVMTGLVAQDLGELSGVGSGDTLDGELELTGVEGWEANDSDAFSFTIPADERVELTASWDEVENDLDFAIFGLPDGGDAWVDWFSSFGETNCRTDASPETCETGVPMPVSGGTYYIVALGYLGGGLEAYHIALDWRE